MKNDIKDEVKSNFSEMNSLTFSDSSLMSWLQDPRTYKEWLDKHTPLQNRIAAFSLTLETLLKNWAVRQDHYQPQKLFSLVIQGIHCTHEVLAKLKSERYSPHIIADWINAIISSFLDLLNRFSNMSAAEINLKGTVAWDVFIQQSSCLLTTCGTDLPQSNLLGLNTFLLLTQKLYQTELLAPARFFNVWEHITTLVEEDLIFLESDKAVNLYWLEEIIKKQPHLSTKTAAQCLRFFSSLTDKHYLKQAVNGTTVDILLDHLVTAKDVSLDCLLTGLENFENLLAWRFNLDAGKLLNKLNPSFHRLISSLDDNPEVKSQSGTDANFHLIRTVKLIRKIFQTIIDRSTDPYPMTVSISQKLLQAVLNHTHQLSQSLRNELVIAIGEILHIGRSAGGDKKYLQETVEELAGLFNKCARQMSLPDVSRALYGLSLLGSFNVPTTTALVARFENYLKNPEIKLTRATIAQAHQGAQYLVRSGIIGLDLPDYLKAYITASTPPVKRKSRQSALRQYLIKQNWFTPYDFIAEETFGIYPTDICITHQETNQKYIFELDDDDHLEGPVEEKQERLRWKDELRDQWLLGLKNRSGDPIIKSILRLPLWPPNRADIETLATKIQGFIFTPAEVKKPTSALRFFPEKKGARVEVLTLPIDSPIDKKEEKSAINKIYVSNTKKKHRKKQNHSLVKQNTLLTAINNKKTLEEMKALLKRPLENFSDSQKAHVLIRILETPSTDQMDILELVCKHFSAEVLGSTDQKGLSPIVQAVKLNLLQAVKIFAAKTLKKIKLPAPEWQKAAQIAQEKRYQTIVEVLKEKGLDSLHSDEKKPLPINSTHNFLDSNIFLYDPAKKDKLSYSEDLLLPMLDFFKSTAESMNTFSEQQLQTIACQGNSNAQLLLAILMERKKEVDGFLYWLEKAAKGGNVVAQCELGAYLLESKKTAGDQQKKAFEWLRKSAEGGLTKAQSNLGVCYQYGRGVEMNPEQAIKWYLKAAKKNCAVAQNNLALYYLSGISVRKNERKAMALLRKSANQGSEFAQYNLGLCYCKGIGVAANYEETVKWYKKAAKQDFPSAQSALAHCYSTNPIGKKDAKKAFYWFRKAAENDFSAEDQVNLGQCYFYGNGVEKDYKEARKWYLQAIDQNIALAQHHLGLIYVNGLGVEKNYKEAAKWFHKAAEQGTAPAQHSLSSLYREGWGVEKSDREFEKWALKAAEQGLASAQYNLGYTYITRRASTREASLGVYWLTLAASGSLKQAQEAFPTAQFTLGLFFLVDLKKNEAIYWLKLSADQGMTSAKDFLEVENSGMLDMGFFRPAILKMLAASPTELMQKSADIDEAIKYSM